MHVYKSVHTTVCMFMCACVYVCVRVHVAGRKKEHLSSVPLQNKEACRPGLGPVSALSCLVPFVSIRITGESQGLAEWDVL